MAINSQLSTTESKKQTKQTSRTGQNHRNGDHMEGSQQSGRGKEESKVQRISSINGR